MKLKKVILKNVRHFSIKVFEFDENSELLMPNEGGKSTLADAITFLLVGKLYSSSSDLTSLKPVHEKSLEVSVEATLAISDSRDIIVKKVYQENWVKTRGSSDVEMKGHITSCFINEKKMTTTNYEKELCGYFNVPSTRELNIMLNPYLFSQNLTWKERLEIIKWITGEIKPEDIFESAPATNELRHELASMDYDVPALKLKLLHSKKNAKQEIHDIEVQIKGFTFDETVTKEEADAADELYNKNLKKITDLKAKKIGVKNPVIDDLEEQRQDMIKQINQSTASDNAELIEKNKVFRNEIDRLGSFKNDKQKAREKLLDEKREFDNKIYQLKYDNQSLEKKISLKNAEKSGLSIKYDEVMATTFKPNESVICDACGHDLSEKANEISLAEFNKNKAAKLKEINKNGMALKQEILDAEKQVATNKKAIDKVEEEIKLVENNIKKIDEEISKIALEISSIESKKVFSYVSKHTEELKEKLHLIVQNISEEQNKPNNHTEIDEEIEKLTLENEKQKDITAEYMSQENLKRRKTKLEENKISVMNVLSSLENREDLLTLYQETYLQILTLRTEHYLPGIKFKFIEENIKAGSWNETCYVMVETENGVVPYETANTANKIKIGVRIANLLAKALDWNNAPMVIDNCEAITAKNRVFDTKAQLITLVADDLPPKELLKDKPQQVQLEM